MVYNRSKFLDRFDGDEDKMRTYMAELGRKGGQGSSKAKGNGAGMFYNSEQAREIGSKGGRAKRKKVKL